MIKAMNVGYHRMMKLLEDAESNEFDPQGRIGL